MASSSSSVVQDLRVTPVQTNLHWHDPEANRQALAIKMAELAGQTDIIVLPEMFTSGFTLIPERDGVNTDTIDWLLEQSSLLGAAITGSIAYQLESGHLGAQPLEKPPFVNRLLFARPDGKLEYYDKVHLFRMGDEHKRYNSGNQRKIIQYKQWRLLLTVCYDLRFPVFCRNQDDYDLMICVANWPESRRDHWRTLLKARAIENQAYVVGVNRVGTDGNGLSYSGDSMVLDCRGEALIDQPGEWLDTAELSYDLMEKYRSKFPVWQDADVFSLELKVE